MKGNSGAMKSQVLTSGLLDLYLMVKTDSPAGFACLEAGSPVG